MSRSLEFIRGSLGPYDAGIAVYEPNDESIFLERFSTPPHESNHTTSLYIDNIGLREVSTLALHWMALQRANNHRLSFRNRHCHDFAATFLKGDLMENGVFGAREVDTHFVPRQPISEGQVHAEIARVSLNTAIILGRTSDKMMLGDKQLLRFDHSTIAVTESPVDPQLFMSKFNSKGNVFVHTLEAATEYYGSTHYARTAASSYYIPIDDK